MIVTEEIIQQGRSLNGGWSSKQLQVFGIDSFVKGWKLSLIGKSFSEGTIKKFLNLRSRHLGKKNIKKKTKNITPSARRKLPENTTGQDKTYKDTWNVRGAKLSCSNYQEYLQSDHWIRVKLKASKRPNYQKCEFCDDTKIELHHKTYKWINTKYELSAIIALCRTHHQEVHDLARIKSISVRRATINLNRVYKSKPKEAK